MIKLAHILLEDEQRAERKQAMQARKTLQGTSKAVQGILEDIEFMYIKSYNNADLNALIDAVIETATDEEFEQALRVFEKQQKLGKYRKVNSYAVSKYIGIVAKANREKSA